MLSRRLAVIGTLVAIFASRADLLIENLALRQQLAVLQRMNPRPRLLVIDRLLWLGLRHCWPRGEEALAIVQPATGMRWHREGSRRYGRWTSRRDDGRPSTTADIRALVHRMAAENPSWGAPRIHGEIRKLGLVVSERTVSRFMPRLPVDPEVRQCWRTFRSNPREVIAAIHHMGIESNQITARSPWQNGVAERFVSTARRDLLDHVIVLNEKHLLRLPARFASYDLEDRTHLSLKKDAPAMRALESKPDPAAEVIALPRLGGLHHRCCWRPAA